MWFGPAEILPEIQRAADQAVRRLSERPRRPRRDLDRLGRLWFSQPSCFTRSERAAPTAEGMRVVARWVAHPDPNLAVGALVALRSAAIVCDRGDFSALPRSWAGIPEARDAVARALEREILVRLAAADLLAGFPDAWFTEALRRRLDDPVYTVRWRAIRALARIAPAPELLDALAASRPRTERCEYDRTLETLRPR